MLLDAAAAAVDVGAGLGEGITRQSAAAVGGPLGLRLRCFVTSLPSSACKLPSPRIGKAEEVSGSG